MLVAVDFDGTIVEHKYPEIGKEIPFAIDTLKKLGEEGYQLALWTSREGKYLEDAINFCKARGLEFYSINSEYPSGGLDFSRENSRKIAADVFIDDKNIGGLPEWGSIYNMLHGMKAAGRKHKKRRSLLRRLFGR